MDCPVETGSVSSGLRREFLIHDLVNIKEHSKTNN